MGWIIGGLENNNFSVVNIYSDVPFAMDKNLEKQ
jgi:hypothetical protein